MHGGENAPVVRFCASETPSLISNGWVLKFFIRIILNLSSIQHILLFKHLHLPTESLPNHLVVLFPIVTALNLVHSNLQYRLKKKTSSSIPPICSWAVGKWLNIMFQIFWFFFSWLLIQAQWCFLRDFLCAFVLVTIAWVPFFLVFLVILQCFFCPPAAQSLSHGSFFVCN